MKTLRNIIILLAAAVLLCSCGGNEPNDSAFVVALGFDKSLTNEQNYKVTIQFARVSQISGGTSEEGGKAGAEIVQNITVDAPDIYAAINTANHIVSKKFSLSHSKLIVFSREIAENGIGGIVDTVIRSDEIKPDVFIAVAENAYEYLSEVKPVVEVNPAKYYQLVYGENESGGIPKTNLLKFYFSKEQDDISSVLPLAGISEAEASEGEQKLSENKANEKAQVNEEGFEYHVKNYTAGQTAIIGENKSEAMGAAVFKGDKMAGTIGSIDGEIYNILMGNMKYSYLNFKSGKGETPVALKLGMVKKPEYRIDMKNKKIKINMYFDSDLYSMPYEDININELEQEITNAISDYAKNFIIRMRDEYKCDILGLEKHIKREFLTIDKLSNYNFKEDFINYDIEINPDFNIRRIGMKL